MRSVLELERIAAGEMPSDLDVDAVEAVESLRSADRVFINAHPTLPSRPPARRWRGSGIPWQGAVLALAAALAVVVILAMPSFDDGLRIKRGDLGLLVYHRTPAGSEILVDGVELAQGEEIQLACVTAKKREVVILSVDGRGTVTRHFPLDSDRSGQLEPGKPALLPYAYRLDDAPDFELLVAIASERPFAVSAAEDMAKALSRGEGGDAVKRGFSAAEFRIIKKMKDKEPVR
ncbi:MAG: DUF4384 domain-containing protein [Spirochaetota bacterium]